jgi:hypothetical protein
MGGQRYSGFQRMLRGLEVAQLVFTTDRNAGTHRWIGISFSCLLGPAAVLPFIYWFGLFCSLQPFLSGDPRRACSQRCIPMQP